MTLANLDELLKTQFPGLAMTLGGKVAQRPTNEKAFRIGLERLSLRLRRRNWIVIAMIVIWFLALVSAAVFAHDVKSIAAIGAMGAGTPWCIQVMRTANRQIFAIELLLLAASDPDADLSELIQDCRDILRGDKDAAAARKLKSDSKAREAAE